MIRVGDHSDILSAQYLLNVLKQSMTIHNITTVNLRKMMLPRLWNSSLMQQTLLNEVHTSTVDKAINTHCMNSVVDYRSPQITILLQFRSGQCHMQTVQGPYRHPPDMSNSCPHLHCRSKPTSLTTRLPSKIDHQPSYGRTA